MIKTEPCVPHPLFGKFPNLEGLNASNSSAECQLILARVEALDSLLKAEASLQIACKFLWSIRDRSPSRINAYVIMFEKLLLWCFYIRKKFLLDLTDLDIFEFRSFYMSPPRNWIAKRSCSRYKTTTGGVRFNKDWRPFTPPGDVDGRKRQISDGLNRIIKEVLPNTTLRALLPTDRYSVAKISQMGDEDATVMIEKYLDYLFGLRSIRGAHEIKLFLFACAAYLRVDVPGFVKLSPHLYLNDIAPKADDGFYWKYDTPYQQAIHSIPAEFGRYLVRYCDAVGFNITESYPPNTLAFQHTTAGSIVTGKTIKTWFAKIPAFREIGFTPSELLKQLAKNLIATEGRVKISQKKRKQTMRIDSKRRFDKFKFRLDGMRINSRIQVENSVPLNGASSVYPLFCLTENNGEVIIHLNYSALHQTIDLAGRSMAIEYIDSVRTLLLYINNHLDGVKLRRPATASEILILWTMLIRRKPLCMLSETDVVEFFEFCCTPPASWITINKRRLQRRLDAGLPKYDPLWRPFRTSRGQSRARAAMIITHCSQMQAWAIKYGLQNFNVFLNLTRKLWRGCE
jgi:hypothetical protein